VAQRTLVIVNPRSRNGATGRRWVGVERRLRARLGPLEVEHTGAPRDAERIAREGVRSGVDRVLVAGGDGTLGEVVTGLLAADLGGYAQLGLLPLGTGSDFVRSVGSPRRIEDAIACIASGRARPVDAGRVEYVDDDGKDGVRYFANVASFGISGLVDEFAERATRRLGGSVAFLIGALRALLQYRSERVEIRVDGELVYDGPLVLGTGANGRYFGGGMRVAPEARIDDGLLDVVVIAGLPWPRLLARLPKLYRGTHVHDAAATHHRGRVIEARAEPGLVKLELDGEPIGTLPARCEVLPGALSVIGPA